MGRGGQGTARRAALRVCLCRGRGGACVLAPGARHAWGQGPVCARRVHAWGDGVCVQVTWETAGSTGCACNSAGGSSALGAWGGAGCPGCPWRARVPRGRAWERVCTSSTRARMQGGTWGRPGEEATPPPALPRTLCWVGMGACGALGPSWGGDTRWSGLLEPPSPPRGQRVALLEGRDGVPTT